MEMARILGGTCSCLLSKIKIQHLLKMLRSMVALKRGDLTPLFRFMHSEKC